ncbi:MAG: TonB-dependent receptor [Acidobacteriota bacterium]
MGRADWIQSSRHTLYGRYFITDYTNPVYYTNNLLTTTRSGLGERGQSATFGDNFVFSPTFINSFHATYTRLMSNRAVAPNMPSPVSLGVNMTNFVPNFINLGVTNYFGIGGGSNAPALFGRNQFQYADDVDIVRGRHHMSFGVDFMALQMEIVNISNANGSWTFNGSLSNSGLADFLLGRPSALTVGNPGETGIREKYWGVYAQDDFQLTKKLNVHLGVRWEPSLPQHDIFGRGSHFDLASFIAGQKTSVYDNAPAGLLFHGDPGIPIAYANGSYNDFAPRIGLAWDPSGTGKESIRASYGIFFDLPESYTNGEFANSAPWGSNISLVAPIGGFANPFLNFPGGNPFPTPIPPTKNVAFAQAGAYINLPLDLHHMYFQQWNLNLQRQLGGNWLAAAAFLGNKATHLRTSLQANPAVYIPGKSTVANTNDRRLLTLLNPVQGAYYSSITQMDDGVNTNYSSLRLSIQHRFANHFTLLSVYTYSHGLADSETIANRLTGIYRQNPYDRNAEYGPCDVDLRHNLVNSFVYESPKFSNRPMNWALGNWKVSFQLTAHSGFVFNTTSGVDNSLTGVGQDRPNVVGNPYVRDTNSLVWLNASAFVANAPGTYGNLGFNALVGPGSFTMDSALSRMFPIHEAHRLELRFEFFNTLNHTNFSNAISNFKSSTFGLIQAASDPRILQFALKYNF